MALKALGPRRARPLADSLDEHYVRDVAGDREGAIKAERAVNKLFATLGILRRDGQRFGGLAVVPFVFFLALHGVDHFAAATLVVPVPRNGSSTVSPTNENMRTSRSASSGGYGAG